MVNNFSGVPSMESDDEMDGIFDDTPIINIDVDVPSFSFSVFPKEYSPIMALGLQAYMDNLNASIIKAAGNKNNVKILTEHLDFVREVYMFFSGEVMSEADTGQ